MVFTVDSDGPSNDAPIALKFFLNCSWISSELVRNKFDNFFVHVPIYSEININVKNDIWVSCQLLQRPFNEHTSLSMVLYLEFQYQRMLAHVAIENSPSCCFWKTKFNWNEFNFLRFSCTLSCVVKMFPLELAFHRRMSVVRLFTEPVALNLLRIALSVGRLWVKHAVRCPNRATTFGKTIIICTRCSIQYPFMAIQTE